MDEEQAEAAYLLAFRSRSYILTHMVKRAWSSVRKQEVVSSL